MVKIRLQRVGRRKKPSYRVVVADSRAPRGGRLIEEIGHYNPLTDPPSVVIHEEKALKWLNLGAQPTDTVASLLRKAGLPVKEKPIVVRGPKADQKAAEANAEAKDEAKG